jgi:DNA polymerase-4
VVTTASYEARRYGIHSATSAARARRLCPPAIFIPPDFAAYRAKSREVWGIVRERLECPLQSVSLDEAYADVTAIERPLRALRDLVAEVRTRTGIAISVGVGPNRLVAKTASDAEKPNGFVVISREQACERFAGEPTRLLQGVGPRTAERLEELGLRTVGDLQAVPDPTLVERFGERAGRWLKRAARFHDDSPVREERVAKSRSSETTFDTDVADAARLEHTIAELAGHVCEGLQARGTRGRTIGIKVRLDDWTNITRARTIEEFTNDPERVTAVARELLREYSPPRPVRLLGVRIASFEAAEGSTNGEPPADGRRVVAQLALPL